MVITDKYIDAIWELSWQELPEDVIEQAKMCVVDYIACASLGANILQKENELYLKGFSDYGKSVVVGLHKKTTVQNAAMLNGINSHMLELDDGHRYGMLHLGAPVISALLALAESSVMDSMHFIKGVVTGYEAAIRLACAIQPEHKLKGFHATGTCGTIGAAVGLAIALGYDRSQLNTVVSAAATDAAGILQVIDEGSQLKPYNVGRAAVAAVNAVCIGRTGLKGPLDALGGKRGFFNISTEKVEEKYLLNGFLPDYAIQRIYRKPYAACRHCHAAIEAVLNLRRENEFNIEDIMKICVDTYGLAVKGHEHTDIQGASSAKMSMPYSVAAALIYGQVNYEQYETECLQNKKIKELMSLTEVREDINLSGLVPGKRAAVVRIITKDAEYRNRVDFPKGEPENPISVKELNDKYYSLMAAAGISLESSRKLLFDINNIETRFEKFLQEI